MTDETTTWHRPATWWGPLSGLKLLIRVFLVKAFRDFLDKRELQGHLSDEVLKKSSEHDVLVDYIADTGDGFNATYAVLSELNPANLGYGDLLVFGGDQVYPGPSAKNYKERFVEPLRSAVPLSMLDHVGALIDDGDIDAARRTLHDEGGNQPWLAHQRLRLATWLRDGGQAALIEQLDLTDDVNAAPVGVREATDDQIEAPWMLAIPGNHDWYDGLTSFERVFMQAGASIGAFKTRQHRSYWAVDLEVDEKRWWLWGVDLSLDSYIDRLQLDYFEHCGAAPGEPVVLFVAAPLWTYGKDRIDHLYEFERKAIFEKGLHLALVVAGDRHYYIRREAVLEHPDGGRRDDAPPRITAGLGGSFKHAPHLELVTPPLWSGGVAPPSKPDGSLSYRAAELEPRGSGDLLRTALPRSFPSERESRRAASFRKSLGAWGRRNRTFSFAPLLLGGLMAAGLLQTSEFWASENLLTEAGPWDMALYMVTGYQLFIVLLLGAFAWLLAAPDPAAYFQKSQRAFWAFIHAAAHLITLWASMVAAQQLTTELATGARRSELDAEEGLLFLASGAVLYAIVMTLVTLIYLAISTRNQVFVNNIASWNLEQNYGGIMRMRFTADEISVEVHGIVDIKTEAPKKIWRRTAQPTPTHPEIVPCWERAPLVLVDSFSVSR